MKTEQEKMVYDLLPAIKRTIITELKKIYTQKRIAKILGITEASISLYNAKKRAADKKLNKEQKEYIKNFAKTLHDKEAVDLTQTLYFVYEKRR